MKMKRWFSVFLSAALAVSAVSPSVVLAAEQKTSEMPVEAEAVLSDLPDNDVLFAGYVEELFLGNNQIAPLGDYAQDKLSGVDLNAYTILKDRIEKIASGEVANTEITMSFAQLGVTKTSWTAADLGVKELVSSGHITQEAMSAWMDQNYPDMSRIQGYLLIDCPYALYWYDKTIPLGMPSGGVSFSVIGDQLTVDMQEGITYQFFVAEEYRNRNAARPELTVDNSIVSSAKKAAENANRIVRKYAYYSDFEKLDGYRQEICALTDYNDEAASGAATPYGNPWQLIWVFDEDPATNVVCEGYAKAFQYLCDMTSFADSNIQCYTITGDMDGGTGAGGHMWNIVTMDDRKNYLVDITNCDEGTIGADDLLFLPAAEGSVSDGYVVTVPGGQILYAYDDTMPEMYGSILQLSKTAYSSDDGGNSLASGNYGENFSWRLDKEGNFIINGTGDMPQLEGEDEVWHQVPWDAHRDEIKTVTVGEGITSIGMMTFYVCKNLEQVVLPESLTSVGGVAFAACGKLKGITFGRQLIAIEMGAFFNCNSLEDLTIPERVEYIGAKAFEDCAALKNVRFAGGRPEEIDATAFTGNELTLHVPSTDREAWADWMKADADLGGAKITWDFYCIEHDWESDYRIDQEANCTTDGSKSIHCKVCGAGKAVEVIPAKGHSLTKTNAVSATCSKKGNIEYYTCQTCRKVFRDAAGTLEISAADTLISVPHRYENVTVKATTSQNGSIVQKCTVCGNVAASSVIYAPQTITLTKDAYSYTGKDCKPGITVTDSSGRPIAAEHYTVTYSNNKAVGTATVSVNFQGNYSGMLTKTFVINPKGTTLSKLKAKARGITVQWKKQTSQTTGYQIQYALNKKFSSAKITKVGNSKTKSKTISKLKSKKKYYVRIRTYKTVKGATYYSSWSKALNIKTK